MSGKTVNESLILNSNCVTAANGFISQAFFRLYGARGEVRAFLDQLQMPRKLSEEVMRVRFNLFVMSNIKELSILVSHPEEGLRGKMDKLVESILKSENPILYKTAWLKCLALFRDTFEMSLPKIAVHSSKEQYEEKSRRVLETIDCLSKLADELRQSIEGKTSRVQSDISRTDLENLNRHCEEVERAVSSALKESSVSNTVARIS